ncbi:MAG: MBL fold metallo-hydrolase [Candidatus Heimdallarchaeota archaeon]|nr:MAG: MBL fold metallo-hydrolase [Candidatus Heimdallarchaeota archaeon]
MGLKNPTDTVRKNRKFMWRLRLMKLATLIHEDLPNFYFIPGENNGSYPNSHSFLIKTDKNEATLFDSGIGHELVKQVLTHFDVKQVFLSHWHEDHISGNYLLKKAGVEFFGHPLDARLLRDISQFQLFYDTAGSPVEAFFQEILMAMNLENLNEIHEVLNNQKIDLADNVTINIIHTPGHSAGHCCFYEPKSHLIYLADIDLSGLGPWYGCIDSNLQDFEHSILKLITMDLEYAISGHKGIFIGKEIIKAQLKKFLSIIERRDIKILEELSEVNLNVIEELIGKRIIYKNYTQMKEYLYIAEKQMISKHLTRLTEQGKISQIGEKYLLT